MEDLEYRNVHSTFGAARHAFSARSSRRQSKRVAIGSQTNQDVLTSLYLSLPILFVQSHTTITSVVVTKPSPSLAILQKRDLTLAAVRRLEEESHILLYMLAGFVVGTTRASEETLLNLQSFGWPTTRSDIDFLGIPLKGDPDDPSDATETELDASAPRTSTGRPYLNPEYLIERHGHRTSCSDLQSVQ